MIHPKECDKCHKMRKRLVMFKGKFLCRFCLNGASSRNMFVKSPFVKQIAVLSTNEQYNYLKQKRKKLGRTMSFYMREFIDNEMKVEKELDELEKEVKREESNG